MKLSFDELILYLQCMNEVLRGIHVHDPQTVLGATLATLTDEDALLRTHLAETKRNGWLDVPIPIRAKVITETMRELEDGVSEFQTRTGFELHEAQALLDKLKRDS